MNPPNIRPPFPFIRMAFLYDFLTVEQILKVVTCQAT